jgi:hypothetical protein
MLTDAGSLNQLLLEGLADVPAHLSGMRFGSLLSRDACLEVAAAKGACVTSSVAVANELSAMRTHADPEVRAAAERVVTELGQRVGYLIATLGLPDTAERQGITAERRAALEHWAGVRRFCLGGGLLSGGLGAPVAAAARAVLTSVSATPRTVAVADDPAWLPLIGAARCADPTIPTAVVLDCGHTSVKAAVAQTNGTAVVALTVLPSVVLEDRTLDSAVRAAVRALRTADGWVAAQTAPPVGQVIVSVASYVRGGQPIRDGRGLYEGFDEHDGWMSDVGFGHLRPTFLHDGTAAWRAVEDTDAVILLGTWLGAGLRHETTLLPLRTRPVVVL